MKYATGLVVGKFCPLHRGHELVINTALTQCEKVIILSYTSTYFPNCDVETRKDWLTNTFPGATVEVLYGFEVPDDNAPANVHRQFCAEYLLNSLETTVQAVYTSEDYGDGFAKHLSNYFSTELNTEINVDHVLVDKARIQYPISGSALRNEIDFDFLSLYVALDFVPRIALLGGESSGKSTLAAALAATTNSEWVPEYGREMYDKRNSKLNYEDMLTIAHTQINTERERSLYSIEKYLFCDTTPLTTMLYSEQLFGRVSPTLRKLAQRKYHKIYLCDPNIDFEQDGTRRDSAFRNVGHEWYIKYLTANHIEYTIVAGTVDERVAFITNDLIT